MQYIVCKGKVCLKNINFCGTYQASSYLSVTSRSPLRPMKVSRPQHLMNPVEKWGSPAANEAMGSSSGVDGGSWAELLTP